MQIIILTGATGGLGSALAKNIWKNDIGRLVCVYRNEVKFQSIFKDIWKDILSYRTYEKDSYERLIRLIEPLKMDEIVLVLNAFSIIPLKPIGEFSYKEINQMID